MTLDEARRELGIDASATPEETRRAYLRGVKIRKPETDPEGFRRLREAYELLDKVPKGPRTLPDAPLVIEAAPPELRALMARLKDLPAETRLEERLATLREGIREAPASAGLRWWLVQELDRAKRHGELLEALREADADGLPGFLEARASRDPESLDAADLVRLEASKHPAILALTAQVHLKNSRPDEAAAALGRAIDRLAEIDSHVFQTFPVWLPRGILGLEAAGRAEEARSLHERLWAWLSGTGNAYLIKRWGAEAQWMTAHELGLLSPGFPAELRRAAALASLTGEREAAVQAARRFVALDSRQSKRASEMLSGLPLLRDLYFEILRGSKPKPLARAWSRVPPSVRLGSRWTLAMACLLALFRFVSATSTTDGTLRPLPTAERPVPQPFRQEARDQGASKAWYALEGGCDGAEPRLPRRACEAAREALRRAQAGDCPGARRSIDTMEAYVRGTGDEARGKLKDFEFRLLLAIAAGAPSCRASGG